MENNKVGKGYIGKAIKKSDKSPDYKGKIDVRGEELEIAGWIREGKDSKFISISIQTPRHKSSELDSKIKESSKPISTQEPDDDIPF